MSEDIIVLYENVNPTMPKGVFVFICSVSLHRVTRWPQTRSIVLVGNEQEPRLANAAGADVALMKGVLVAKLLATVEELLHQFTVNQAQN